MHAYLVQSRRAGVNKHQSLAYAIYRTFKRLSIHHQVESGSPFNVARGRRMDITIERGAGGSVTL